MLRFCTSQVFILPIRYRIEYLLACDYNRVQKFWKKHVFQFFRDISTDLPATPMSMLKNVISVLHELRSSK